jgi:glutamate-ammonia-ligase adenylyltransferase
LRPSGKGGLLVQSIEGFADYQRADAWTWEHQALLRSRAVAGGAELRRRYETLRVELLRTAVRRPTLRDDVRSMRERMRAELSKSKAGEFDLKQDEGGITDVEFLAQYWTLLWSARYSELVTFSDNIRQLESLASSPRAAGDRRRADGRHRATGSGCIICRWKVVTASRPTEFGPTRAGFRDLAGNHGDAI